MGLFRRREAAFPALEPIPPVADLPPARLLAAVRYLGTLDGAGERVVGEGLAARSAARLSLSKEALDVVRVAGSFRITSAALRGARGGDRFAGKAVPDLLVVRWTHGDHEWETGFRLEASRTLREGERVPRVDEWVRAISKMSRANDAEERGSR